MVLPSAHHRSSSSAGTAKVSISLPEDLLERIDRECEATGESRSELFRRALQALFEGRRRDAAVRRYLEGYVAEPEAEYEVAAAGAAAEAAFEDEGWE